MARPTKPRGTGDVCADCSSPDPSWGSINRGVLICDECCSVHRSLGRHVSEVRSLKNGYWSPTLCTMVRQLYSSGANNIWEYALMDPAQNKHARRKPHSNDPLHPNKSDFIRKKYQFLAFLNKQKDADVCTVEDLSRQLHSSVRTNNLETCLRLLSKGADPNYFYPERGNCPMHVAAQAGQTLQVELLVIYGADPGAMDKDGKSPADYAVCDGHLDLADRLIECQYQLTDRLTSFLCNRNPDHKTGQHFLIPEVAESNLDLSELAKQARKKLQALPNVLFEELAKDVYDEVDRRQNDVGTDHRLDTTARQAVLHLPVNPEFSATRTDHRLDTTARQAVLHLPVNPEFSATRTDHRLDTTARQAVLHLPVNPEFSATRTDHRLDTTARQAVLHLPVNPEFSATRNQGRQKLARLNPREFATLIIDILSDAKRRQQGVLSSPKDSEKDDIYEKQPFIKRTSSSEDEPIYDVVADDDDASSVDTVSVRSQRGSQKLKQKPSEVISEEIRPASHLSLTDNESLTSDHHDVSLSVTEYRELREKLHESDKNVQALTQTNQDLHQQIQFLRNQLEKFTILNSTLHEVDEQGQGDITPLQNGHADRSKLETTLPRMGGSHQRTFRSGVRPQSMFEPRTHNSQSILNKETEQISTAASVTNVANDQPPDLPLSKPPSLPDSLPTRRASDYDNSNPSLTNSITDRSTQELDGSDQCLLAYRTSDPSVTDTHPLPTQDDITIITDKISKKIRELMQMAQDKRPDSFIFCADSICTAVQEMLHLFPINLDAHEIKSALDILMSNAIELQSECRFCASNDILYEDLQFRTKRVIQYAYDVAMAAREVVSQLPERRLGRLLDQEAECIDRWKEFFQSSRSRKAVFCD